MYADLATHPVILLFQNNRGISPIIIWIIVILLIVLIFWLLWRERGKRSEPELRETPLREKPVSEPAPQPMKEEVLESPMAKVEAGPVRPVEIPNPAARAVEIPVAPAVDDLEIIEGIGPKIASVLKAAGVTSFAQLADMAPDSIREILLAANLRLADPGSWPEQARLAASGDMTALQALQDRLKGGR